MNDKRAADWHPEHDMQAYAQERGLRYDGMSLDFSGTQITRHGFMLEVVNGMTGKLPGGAEGRLGHLAWVDDNTNRHRFTAILVAIPESVGVISRILCHDRGLEKASAKNPDADIEIYELKDAPVRLESDAFLRRYKLERDHDQPELATWQFFDPSLIDWLTDDAPTGFSFEIQSGAFTAFVPGTLHDPTQLDAFCNGASLVANHLAAQCVASGAKGETLAGDDAPGSRGTKLDQELAAVTFTEVPKNVRAAANKYGWGPLRTPHDWKLGGEAFFREYAKSIGLTAKPVDVYLAQHAQSHGDLEGEPSNLSIPGDRTLYAAEGRLPGAGFDLWLVLSEQFVGFVAPRADLANSDWIGMPFEQDHGLSVTSDGGACALWRPGEGDKSWSKKGLDKFVAEALPVLKKVTGHDRQSSA